MNTINICNSLNDILNKYSNINYMSKEELYLLLDFIRFNFNISIDEPFNVPHFCKHYFKDLIDFEFHEFNDKKIGGFLVKNKIPEKSFIVINISKDNYSTLFDLTHELMHFLLHPEDRNTYISNTLSDIDNFEWQANEGAAELLVPYKKFIPIFCSKISNCSNNKQYSMLIDELANRFVVSPAVIDYRISGLKYEINQFEKGTDIEHIELLSKRAQEVKGIHINSYSQKFKNRNFLKNILNNYTIKREEPKNLIDNIYTSDWTTFLNNLKSNGRIMLYTNLIGSELININTDTAYLSFNHSISPFCKAILNRPENKLLIEQEVYNIYNKKMNVKFLDDTNNIIQNYSLI